MVAVLADLAPPMAATTVQTEVHLHSIPFRQPVAAAAQVGLQASERTAALAVALDLALLLVLVQVVKVVMAALVQPLAQVMLAAAVVALTQPVEMPPLQEAVPVDLAQLIALLEMLTLAAVAVVLGILGREEQAQMAAVLAALVGLQASGDLELLILAVAVALVVPLQSGALLARVAQVVAVLLSSVTQRRLLRQHLVRERRTPFLVAPVSIRSRVPALLLGKG